MAPCQICQGIDLANISAKPIDRLFQPHKTYPRKYDLVLFSTQYDRLQHPVKGLVAYHENLDSLKGSAVSCELCCIVQDQVDTYLRKREVAAKGGSRYPKSFELWICGTSVCNFFQVLGYNRDDAKRSSVESASYYLLAGFGVCVDHGKET
jgi:hypothetical protein